MKTQITSTYDRNNKSYHIRIRTNYEGFQDEIVIKFKPDDTSLLTGTLEVLKDTTGNYETNIILQYDSTVLLNLILTGGY